MEISFTLSLEDIRTLKAQLAELEKALAAGVDLEARLTLVVKKRKEKQ